jgi:hypothetical protein
VAGVAVVGVGAGAYFIVKNLPLGGSKTGGSGAPITINFTYSTEKDVWMKSAIPAFNSSGATLNGKSIQVAATELGSVGGHDQILSGN